MSDAEVDAAYGARATVPTAEFDAIMRAYRTRSLDSVRNLPGVTGIPFDTDTDTDTETDTDTDSGERLDIFGTGPSARPVVIAVHGGYWRMLGREDTAFMAGMLAAEGIATVVPDYTLAPAATLEEIVRQIRQAVAWVWRNGRAHGLDPERIHLVGSSAGGHLAAMAAVPGWQRAAGVPEDVVKGWMAISGLFDIRPLVNSYINDWLGLDEHRAAAVSPLLLPVGSARGVIAVAERDPVGFRAQAAAFHRHWSASAPCRHLMVSGRNHFDIFLDLADPTTAVSRNLIALVGAEA